MPAEGVLEAAPERGVLAIGDEVLGGDLLYGHVRTGHQWVPHGRGHHELLLPEQGGGELVTQGVGVDGRERAVELVVAEHCEDALLGVLDHVDGHVRVLGAELRQHAEEVVRAGRIHAPDPQRAAQQPCQLVELVAEVVDLR